MNKATMAMPADPAAMRRHLTSRHGMPDDDAADMPMPDMEERHGAMHRGDAGHDHPGMSAAAAPGRKSFTPVDLTLSEEGSVTLAFSRLNVVDHDGDVTFPGALPAGKAVPMSDFGHTSWDGALPVGRGVISERDGLGILDGAFFMQADQGRNAYHTVKAMAELQEWSYGYVPLPPSGPEVFAGRTVRALRKLDVHEISPVLLAAGIGTGTLAIKGGDPGPGLPYAEHVSRVRDAVAALVDRSGDRAEWRAKEGRVLSAANRAALTTLLESLSAFGGIADELRELLDATDPQKADRDVTLDVLLGIARRNGVKV